MVSNRNLLIQRSIFRGELLVSGRVCIYLYSFCCHAILPAILTVAVSTYSLTALTSFQFEQSKRGWWRQYLSVVAARKINLSKCQKMSNSSIRNFIEYRYRHRIDINIIICWFCIFFTSWKYGFPSCSGPPLWEQWWGYDLCCRQGWPRCFVWKGRRVIL